MVDLNLGHSPTCFDFEKEALLKIHNEGQIHFHGMHASLHGMPKQTQVWAEMPWIVPTTVENRCFCFVPRAFIPFSNATLMLKASNHGAGGGLVLIRDCPAPPPSRSGPQAPLRGLAGGRGGYPNIYAGSRIA